MQRSIVHSGDWMTAPHAVRLGTNDHNPPPCSAPSCIPAIGAARRAARYQRPQPTTVQRSVVHSCDWSRTPCGSVPTTTTALLCSAPSCIPAIGAARRAARYQRPQPHYCAALHRAFRRLDDGAARRAALQGYTTHRASNACARAAMAARRSSNPRRPNRAYVLIFPASTPG